MACKLLLYKAGDRNVFNNYGHITLFAQFSIFLGEIGPPCQRVQNQAPVPPEPMDAHPTINTHPNNAPQRPTTSHTLVALSPITTATITTSTGA